MSEKRRLIPKIIFPAGVAINLLLAYFLDRWLFTQTQVAQAEGIQTPLHKWTIVSGLVLFFFWLGLSWVTLTTSQKSRLVSVIVLIVGLVLYIYPTLQMLATWTPMLFFTVRTPLSYTGLFVAVLSVLHLLVPGLLKTDR